MQIVSYPSLVVKNVINNTEKKMIAFASRIAPRKAQFTEVKLSLQSVSNIRAGNANVPTKVLSPLVSVSEIKLNLKIFHSCESISYFSTFAFLLLIQKIFFEFK